VEAGPPGKTTCARCRLAATLLSGPRTSRAALLRTLVRTVGGLAMLPQFILVGPKRTATTWLHRVLAEQLCFPAGIKETMFFDLHYARGLRWYESHFSHCDSHCIAAESAPSYFHSQPAIERISRHIPECRIICTLRDPVERLYSLYRLMREHGETQLP